MAQISLTTRPGAPVRGSMALRLGLAVGILALLAWVLARLPLELAVATALAGGGVVMLLRWPWAIWLVAAAGLAASSALKIGSATGNEALLAVALLLALAVGASRRTLRLNMPGFVPALAIYLLVLIAASLDALDLAEAAAEITKWVEFGLVVVLVPLMLPVRRVAWLVAALLLGAVLQAGLGLYQFVFTIGPEWFALPGGYIRASGLFRQPNPYAGYLGLALPVAVSLTLWSWTRLGRRSATSLAAWWIAAMLTCATALIGAGILVSWSRGAWVGVALSLVVVAGLRSRTAAALTVALALIGATLVLIAGIGAAWLPATVAARFQELPTFFGLTDVLNQPVTDENFAVVERVAHWVAALRMWESAPWLGVGPGSYAAAYPIYRLPAWEEALGHAHNVYLNVLAETGVIGLLAFGALWLSVVIWAVRALRSGAAVETPWAHALALGVLGMLMYLAAHSLFDNLFVQGIYLQVALWLAAVAATLPGWQAGGAFHSGK